MRIQKKTGPPIFLFYVELTMAKGKGKGGVTIFEERRQQRMGELENIRARKTTRKTLPKLEKAFGITSTRPVEDEPVEETKVPAGVGEPVGMGRRRKTKKAGRRKQTRRRK